MDTDRRAALVVQFDELGVFEILEPALLEHVSAALTVPSVQSNTVCVQNGACYTNVPCTKINYTCPVNHGCGSNDWCL